ncbi:MAG: GNAT family N-acetyltransferase [Phycisphaerales bacterium]|nr:GNAT family N-acetyltransferase [Phycisphaerales bacterium]
MALIEGDKLPTLKGDGVRLRWLDDGDVAALYEVFSDARVMRYWSTPPWTDRGEAARMIERVRQHFTNGTLYQWGIGAGTPERLIGTCTLAYVDTQNRRAEIGFALRHDCWGRGFMSCALSALLQYAFETLNLHRIEADVDPRNAPCIALLDRLGFQREGLLRERWIVNDEYNDTVFYGLLRREWSAPVA